MIGVLSLLLALNTTSTSGLVPTSPYSYCCNIGYQAQWEWSYFDNNKVYSNEFVFNIEEFLEFNSTDSGNYRMTFTKFTLYNYYKEYDLSNGTLLNSDSSSSVYTANYESDDFNFLSDFYLEGVYTPNGFAYKMYYDDTQVNYFFLSTAYVNPVTLPKITFNTYSFYLNNINYMRGVIASDNYLQGYDDGYASGEASGSRTGYQNGYSDGFTEASSQDSVAVTIFTGICEVGLLPVNVFLGMLNFEVFGINLGGFVASLLTISIIVIVLRVVLGSKGGGDNG